MTSRVKDWTIQLDAQNVLDVTMEVDAGQVVGFALNYRARIAGRWVEVVRYDTNHGYLHVHENWREPNVAVRRVREPPGTRPPYNTAFSRAEEDLRANWRRYRARVERRMVDDDGR